MRQFIFDPPVVLKGNVLVRTLDDAARFMADFRQARWPALWRSVLHRLEGAAGEVEEREAGYAFRGWAEIERIVLKPDRDDFDYGGEHEPAHGR